MKLLAKFATLTLLVGISLNANAQEYVYWTNSGTKQIERSDLLGSKNEAVVKDNIVSPYGIALHVENDAVYWTDYSANSISVAGLDGSNASFIVKETAQPTDIAVARGVGKLYWIESGSNSIVRANLDGSNAETVASKLPNPTAIAVDENSGSLFWADSEERSIYRATLEGQNAERIITSNLIEPSGLAVYSELGKIFWTDQAGFIASADLDGSNVQPVVKEAGSAQSIAIDAVTDRIYWIDADQKELRRAYSNGDRIETVASELSETSDIALIPSIALPLEVTNLDGYTSHGKLFLSWESATVTEPSSFEVQRQLGSDFEAIAYGGVDRDLKVIGVFSYSINNPEVGRHTLRIKATDDAGLITYSRTIEIVIEAAEQIKLSSPYPNPTSYGTTFSVTSGQAQEMSIVVSDLLGRIVSEVYQGTVRADERVTFTWDSSANPNGVYFIRVVGKAFSDVARVTVSK